MQALSEIKNPQFRKFLEKALDENDKAAIEYAQHLRWYPVGPEEFFMGSYYMNLEEFIYPTVLDDAIELNSGKYQEGALVGSLGAAKSYLGIISQAYVLYKLSCLKSPQRLYGLDPDHEIMIIFQAINKDLAKKLGYDRFRPMIERSKYFQQHFPHDRSRTSVMHFPNTIQVLPIGASANSAIGQNIISGNIEEVNFADVIKNSKKSVDGGTYDQARTLYDVLTERRRSRFITNGELPGLILAISSRNYPGQLTDDIELAAKTDETVFIYDKTSYQVRPEKYSDVMIPVFIGHESLKPKILTPEEAELYDESYIRWVPEDFRKQLEKNLNGALRDIVGVSTLARAPYFSDSDSVHDAMGVIDSIFVDPDVDFHHKPCKLNNKVISKADKTHDRAIHVDLALTGDSAGFVMSHIKGFTKLVNDDGVLEAHPEFVIDGSLQVLPPPDGEILFSKLRKLIYVLTDKGFNIKYVTFDSFQSADSIQILRQKGYIAGRRSVDTDMRPWAVFRAALVAGTVQMPAHYHLQKELLSLEYDPQRDKVDHLSTGTKDVSDSLVASCYQLYSRKYYWLKHGVMPALQPTGVI